MRWKIKKQMTIGDDGERFQSIDARLDLIVGCGRA